MLSYEIYTGAETSNVDGSAVQVCDRLVNKANLTASRGRVLYTDNWYTSMKLAKHFFEKYGWTICGTVPFLKLSGGALMVERGWFREAVIKMKTPSGKTYYIQCTTWRDKK